MSSGINMSRPVEILLVEDSPTDAELTREALAEGKMRNNVSHVTDGVEALAFLRKTAPYEQTPFPDLVLLDLKMPRKNGLETLSEIRSDSALKHLVIIILTTSSDERDVVEAYGLNVNAYIVKPVDLSQFFQIVHYVDHFCLRVMTLPPNGNSHQPRTER